MPSFSERFGRRFSLTYARMIFGLGMQTQVNEHYWDELCFILRMTSMSLRRKLLQFGSFVKLTQDWN